MAQAGVGAVAGERCGARERAAEERGEGEREGGERKMEKRKEKEEWIKRKRKRGKREREKRDRSADFAAVTAAGRALAPIGRGMRDEEEQ